MKAKYYHYALTSAVLKVSPMQCIAVNKKQSHAKIWEFWKLYRL